MKTLKKSMKTIGLFILCLLCLMPAILIVTGKATITHRGGMSTMGVIIGPIVGIDDVINPGVSGTVSSDHSGWNLSADTPYTNGALRAYNTIGVYNVVRDSYTSNGFKYASFIRYFRISRTDGRVIYDDDGILDVSTSKTNLASEIVNYPSYIYSIETTLPIKKKAGFLWTDQQSKFKNTTLNFIFGFVNSTGTTTEVYDMPTNPSNTYEDYSTLMYKGTYGGNANTYEYLTVTLTGTGQNSNTFWGGTGGDCNVNTNLTNYINIGKRDWSNTLTASNTTTGTYNGYTTLYSPKAFTAIASNLNNFIKINDVQATPKYGTSVVPFANGHHIEITDDGYTKVAIENGAEGRYTTYYCMVDTKLPDVSYTYHNANALDTRKVGSITTNANGSKSQTINEGVFRDQVQVNFSYNSATESPETATYTYNGKTYNLSNGDWLSQEGNYTVTITDKAGNTTISKFTIDKSAPSYNLNRLQNDSNYKVAKWYLVDIPYGYTGFGTYSFKEYADALSFAETMERQNKITSYVLTDLNDFTATNIVAKNNTIKLGDYWYYKSIDNPELYVYYFDENSLNEAVNHYAKTFVSSEQIYKQNSSLYPNNYGNTIDESIYDNIIEVNGIKAYIATNYVFKQQDTNESYKLYCAYQNGSDDVWQELQYNLAFKEQVTTYGLYKIKEVDYVGHETTYYVFLDNQMPMVDFEAKVYGSNKTISQTISQNDIPKNGELIFYYEDFTITGIVEDDNWWTIEIKLPTGIINRYTKFDEIPSLSTLGSGEFTITVADRTNETFKFTVCILGAAPEVKFNNINANTQLSVKIENKDASNILRDLKIYRNGVCLNSDTGYYEYQTEDCEPIFISANKLSYIFNRGGIYIVEITDNFGRTLSYEYKFEKDLPTGILSGVAHNGKTNGQVQFSYNNSKYYVVVTKENALYNAEKSENGKTTTLSFFPEEDSEISYFIQLIDLNDNENYNEYRFTIKTIKPIINLYGVEPNGKTGGSVYATWDTSEEQYTASYTLNGITQEYRKGQTLTAEGSYEITLSDEIGNTNTVNFIIDKTIEFYIADVSGNTYTIEQIEYINFDIRLIEDEPLSAIVRKNNVIIDYEFGLMLTEEGSYNITLKDEYGNSLYFSFTIDKTAPVATLYGVDNYGTTSKSAWIASMESGLTCWAVKDGTKSDYKLGTELTASGNYVVVVADRAKNITSFEFTIDNTISYDINTYHGGISNGGVRIIAYENLKIVMYKNEQPFEYEFEQILNDEGEYSFTIFDDIGNKTSSFFTIITKNKKNLNHILQEDISISSITKNDENFGFETIERKLYLYDEGIYKVNILDEKTDKEYSFEITIDTTPPTLELINVENGKTTKKVVVMKNISEENCTLYITVDGVPFEYKLGDEIEKCGRFIVTLTDEAGNSTTYTFEREYSLNGPSIAVIVGLCLLVILIIILLAKSRHHYYKDEQTQEVIEETIIEDDFPEELEENDENAQNDEQE